MGIQYIFCTFTYWSDSIDDPNTLGKKIFNMATGLVTLSPCCSSRAHHTPQYWSRPKLCTTCNYWYIALVVVLVIAYLQKMVSHQTWYQMQKYYFQLPVQFGQFPFLSEQLPFQFDLLPFQPDHCPILQSDQCLFQLLIQSSDQLKKCWYKK